jgi:hypothetical protein
VKRQANAFDVVKRIGLTLPDVEAATRYDGSPVLKLAGVFMAGLATHSSAEPNTLVVRADIEERESFIEDAPETYYLMSTISAIPWYWCGWAGSLKGLYENSSRRHTV